MAEIDKDVDAIRPASPRLSFSQEHENQPRYPEIPSLPHSEFSLRQVSPVGVKVDRLCVQFKSEPPIWNRFAFKSRKSSPNASSSVQTILEDVSADMPAGSLTAIIGGSGSGKTTLLNTIAQRVTSSKMKNSGHVMFNGQENPRIIRSSYVMQQDILLPTLTVRETLRYSADLRLAAPSNAQEREDIVEGIIRELGLIECADTRIGSNAHRGCSGGEKRRTSIGVQMLANPSVLFCDEPTTGLDAHSAFQVVQTLKKLAEQGRTVIISIHSPRSEIWTLFDGMILLSKGYILYTGPANEAIPHFQELGFEMPAFFNPAEFLIDLAAIDNRSEELESVSRARVFRLRDAWSRRCRMIDQGEEFNTLPGVPSNEKSEFENKQVNKLEHDPTDLERVGDLQPTATQETFSDTTSQPLDPPDVSNEDSHATRVSFSRQVRTLTRRGTKVALRDPMGVAGTLAEVTIMAIIAGWVFLQLGTDQTGIRSRMGACYVAVTIQGYLFLLVEVYRLTTEIQLFDRERAEGAVTVPAFLLSRRLSRALIEDLPSPIIFSVIFYFMVGFRAEAPTFFIFLAILTITHYISVTLAMVCIAVSRDFAGASLVANLVYTLQSFCAGYFVQQNQIAIWLRWMKWTAFVFYLFGATASNEFIGVNGGDLGQLYDCPYSNFSNPACQQHTGRYIMNSLGFPNNWLWRPILIAFCFIIAFSIGAGFILTFWKRDIGIASIHKKEQDTPTVNVVESVRSRGEVRHVTVGLEQYGLDVQMRHLWKPKRTKIILHPISAQFEPGCINAIMGPSGSGKTSLLQSLGHRLKGNLFSKYLSHGKVTVNGAVPSASVINSITSFVTQDDDALMPSLTVRETLLFAAGLRLPSWMSKAEKKQRAEDVILKMGLKDCADRLVGSDIKKGISGGEKRRVSIAVQILTDPKVLLLDEPTSGLDAFTASSVIEVLKHLADEGRTIIVTIHQARSDLFSTFQNVLLLARGGHLVYAGPGPEMLSYFRTKLSLECAQSTNPADFVLDHITIDLQRQDRETASREKVQRIVQEWENNQQRLPMGGDEHKNATMSEMTVATPAELSSFQRQMNPFRVTFPIVLRRSAINIRRTPDIMVARVMQVFGIGVVITCFFSPLQNNYEAIQSRFGIVQEYSTLYFVGMLQNLAVYPSERATFYTDHTDTCYTPTTFLLSYTLLELPFEITSSLLLALLLALASNLQRTFPFFCLAALNAFCIVNCGESVGIAFCTIFSEHMGFAVNVTSTLMSVAAIMGGVLSLNVPGFLEAVNHASPIKWAVGNLAVWSMRGQTFSCSEAQMVGGKCAVSTGEEALALYRLDVNPGIYVGVLVAVTVAYRLAAWGVLWVVKR